MKRMRIQKHAIAGIFVFLLLGIFAVAATVMVLLGAQAYQGSADRAQLHNAERIASAYLRSKLREADAQGRILLDPEAAHLTISNPEERTVTILYVYDGMLYDWYTLQELAGGNDVSLDGTRGEAICPLDEMHAQVQDGLVTITLRNGAEESEIFYALRAEGAVKK